MHWTPNRPKPIIRLCLVTFVFASTVLLASAIKVLHIPVVLAQGPAIYTFDTYATYQFHTLNHPTGLAPSFDSINSIFYLFIADTGNNVIRQFVDPPAGGATLSTLAGNGTPGYVDSSTASAEFNQPTGVSGGFYSWLYYYCSDHKLCQTRMYYYDLTVADTSNFVIRHICLRQRRSGSGGYTICDQVVTVAGNHSNGYVDGPSLSAEFSALGGIFIRGTYYIADPENNVIRSWDGTNVTTFAGNGTHGLINGYRTNAAFGAAIKMAWDGSGNMYVTDADNFVIRKIDTAGNVTTFAGSGTPGFADGQGTAAQFTYPGDIVFNPADGYFYITDTGNNAIRRMDVYGNVTTYAGSKQGGLVDGPLLQARFQSPTGLAISGAYMYVADTMNNAIRRIDMNAGQVSTYID